MFVGVAVLTVDLLVGPLGEQLVVERTFAGGALEALLVVVAALAGHLLGLEDLASAARAGLPGVAVRVTHDDGGVGDDLRTLRGGDDLEADAAVDVLVG